MTENTNKTKNNYAKNKISHQTTKQNFLGQKFKCVHIQIQSIKQLKFSNPSILAIKKNYESEMLLQFECPVRDSTILHFCKYNLMLLADSIILLCKKDYYT